MRNIICTALILIFGTVAFGQKQVSQSATVSGSSDTSVSSNKGVILNSGTKIDGRLQNTIDVKKANVGDRVILKTTRDIKQNGRIVIAKGSSLVGRITEVAQKTNNNGRSRLGMVFDRIQGRDLSAPINASIVSVTNVVANGSLGDVADADLYGTSETSARTSSSSSSSSSSGGGLLGGVANTAGGVLHTTTSTVGGVTNSVGPTVGNTTNSLGRTVNGIQILNSVNASARSETTLSAADRNIRLDKGATIQLQLNSSARAQ